jgi:tetratricopeptide (TPR) repeat protein
VKNVRIYFKTDEDFRKNSRAIYNMVIYLNSNHNPKLRVFPLLDETDDKGPVGINLFGSSDEVKKVTAEVMDYLKELKLEYKMEDAEVDVEGFVEYHFPVMEATNPERMEQLLAERSFGFRKLPQSLREADMKAFRLWRNLRGGIAFYHLRMPEEAKKQLEKALELDPNNFEAHHHLGLVFEMMDEPEKAIKELEIALANDDESGSTHFFLANTLQKLGDFEKSIEH